MDDTVTSVPPRFSICHVWASGIAIVPSAFTHIGTFVGIDTVTFSSYIVESDAGFDVSPYDLAGTDMDAARYNADRISAIRQVSLYPPPDIFLSHEQIHIVPYISVSRHAAKAIREARRRLIYVASRNRHISLSIAPTAIFR